MNPSKAVDAEMEIRRDQELEDLLMKRNEALLPSESICRELALLCNRVTSALESLMVDPAPGTPGIEDVKVVGSFKKGTLKISEVSSFCF